MKTILGRLPSELAPRDSAGLSRPTTAYAMIAISHQAAGESSETESRHVGLIPTFPTNLTDPVPAESRSNVDAGPVSTVAVTEGLEKRGNEGVSLTGAMTLSAPAFAIR